MMIFLVFLVFPTLDREKKEFGENECIGVIVNTDKGAQAAMCSTTQIVSMINQKFLGELKEAFTKQETKDGYGNA